MELENEISKIKKLIASGEIEKPIDILLTKAKNEDEEIYKELLVLKSRFSRLKRDTNSATISGDDISISQNQLRRAILNITDSFNIGEKDVEKSRIRELIAEGKLDEAIKVLINYDEKFNNTKSRDDLILIQNRFSKIKQTEQNGTATRENIELEYNKLNLTLLELLDLINKSSADTAKIQSKKIDSQSNIIEQNIPLDENWDDLIIKNAVEEKIIDLYSGQQQVNPVFGDMFEAEFDLILIPQDANGGLSVSMRNGLKRLNNSDLPYEMELSSISSIYEINNPDNFLAFVATSKYTNSNLNAIEEIGKILGETINTWNSSGIKKFSGIKKIVSPLLGTGSPGLDKIKSYQALEKGFLKTINSDAKLFVHIIDKESYDEISRLSRMQMFKTVSQGRSSFNSDSAFGEDQLDIMDEVKALANLVASSDLKPPLSIGLFGNWGTGKSFFMEKLSEEVDDMITISKSSEEENGICKNIVQIKFNAWYYIDANLWASIVSSIFDQLSDHLGFKSDEDDQKRKLYEKLASTEAQIRAANDQANQYKNQVTTLATEIENLKDQRTQKRQALEEIKLKHLAAVLTEDDTVSKFIGQAQKLLGFSDFKATTALTAKKSVEDLEGLISRYKSTHGRFATIVKDFLRIKNWWSFLLLFSLIFIPILAFFFLEKLPDFNLQPIVQLFGKIGSVVVAISLFIKELINKSDPILQNINSGISHLEEAKTRLVSLQDVASSETDEEIAILQNEYDQLNEKHQKAITLKWEAEKNLKIIENDIDEIKAGKRMDSFVKRRVQSNDYGKHLGLISIVRKDFEELSIFLQNHRDSQSVKSAMEKVQKQSSIDRIILYIDDLDRCPPERVVDVLQAIHLILAFPLFVVVVGVDVRWVSKSLMKKYGQMLSEEDSNASSDPQIQQELKGNATPFDYLEKIFQIPFKLKNISDGEKKKYIEKLLEKDVVKIETEEIIVPSEIDHTQKNILNKEEDKLEIIPTVNEPSNQIKSQNLEINTKKEEVIQNTKRGITPQKPKLKTKRWDLVKLTKEEFNFITGLTPIAGQSARTIKRFVNLARLIKSNPNWIPDDAAINTKPYHACLFMLAVVVGGPWMFPLFFSLIKDENESEDENKAKTLGALVKKKEIEIGREIDKHGHINQEWDALRVFLENIENHHNVDIQAINFYHINSLVKIIPTVSRFSFRTMEEVEVEKFLKTFKTNSE